MAKSLFNISFLFFITRVEYGKVSRDCQNHKGVIAVTEIVMSHKVTCHSHNIWQRSQLMSSMEIMGTKRV